MTGDRLLRRHEPARQAGQHRDAERLIDQVDDATRAAVKARLATLAQETFLPGMNYDVSFDVSRFLDASVHEVVKTLLEAFVLVFLVVFLFLQDLRATFIPVITVPVSDPALFCRRIATVIGAVVGLVKESKKRAQPWPDALGT